MTGPKTSTRIIPVVALLAVAHFVPVLVARTRAADATLPAGPHSLPSLRAARTDGPIHVDGRLDEPDWGEAEAADHFTQLDPREGEPASEKTEVRVLVDEEAIYIGARLHDRTPGEIRAHLARRDDSSDSDLFQVFLDSFRDHVTAWRFDVNPAGAIRDAAIYADGNTDDSWDAVWQAGATIDSSGWVAEMRIPLSQLHYNGAEDASWGVQFTRLIHRNQEKDYFAFTPKKEQVGAGVDRYGTLTGLGRLPRQRHLELLPYLASSGRFRDVSSGNPFDDGNDYSGQAGLDLKYGLGPDLTLCGTINPDFGQAEVDPAVVNLSAYETFYPEKRPFFVADAGNFSFGSIRTYNNFGFGETFYTRRIGRPPHLDLTNGDYQFVDQPDQSTIAAAAKVTGKTRSGWTVGGLEALTTKEKARFIDLDGNRGEAVVEPATNFLVGRLARDLRGGDTQVGLLGTAVNRRLHTEELDDNVRSGAYLAGIDWKHAWAGREWSFDGFLLGSRVTGSEEAIAATQRSSAHYFLRPDASHVAYDPTRTSLSGYHGTMALAKNGGEHWRGSLMTQFMSPGYEVNDLGFMNRADRYTFTSLVMHVHDRPGPLFRSYAIYPFTYHAWNFGGKLINAGYAVGTESAFANYWGVTSQLRFEPSAYDDDLTRGGPIARTADGRQASVTVTSDSRKPYTAEMNGTWFANNREGRSQSYSLSISFRPSPGMQVSVGPSWNALRSPAQFVTSLDDPTATATYGRRYVFATLEQKTVALETRLNWIFSPRVSLQLFMQPLISSGDYRDYKEFREPATFDFDVYGEERGTISRDPDGVYTVDPDGGGAAGSFTFEDPNFNFRSLRGNAVLRWEYRPGSTIFLIWQQSRSETSPDGNLDLGRDLDAMIDAPAENILMAKITTWLGW